MAKINIPVNAGIQTYRFTDENGDVISSFQMNPTDVRIAARCQEISESMGELSDRFKGVMSAAEVAELNRELEEKVNYVLGYSAAQSVFVPPLTATTILEDGTPFAFLMLETISQNIKPAIEKRKQAMNSRMAELLRDYE